MRIQSIPDGTPPRPSLPLRVGHCCDAPGIPSRPQRHTNLLQRCGRYSKYRRRLVWAEFFRQGNGFGRTERPLASLSLLALLESPSYSGGSPPFYDSFAPQHQYSAAVQRACRLSPEPAFTPLPGLITSPIPSLRCAYKFRAEAGRAEIVIARRPPGRMSPHISMGIVAPEEA